MANAEQKATLAEDATIATATDFLLTDITFEELGLLRVNVALKTAATFSVKFGSVFLTLEKGVQLGADQLFGYDLNVTRGDTVNFRHGDGGPVDIRRFNVQFTGGEQV